MKIWKRNKITNKVWDKEWDDLLKGVTVETKKYNKWYCNIDRWNKWDKFYWFIRYGIWNWIIDLKWRIPTVLHRMFYGWGYADTWSLDSYLSKIIYESLKYQKKHTRGYVIYDQNKTDKENELFSNDLYNDMIYAFKLAKEIGEGKRNFYLPNINKKLRKKLFNCLTREEDRKMKKGMKLFIKHFFNLWS